MFLALLYLVTLILFFHGQVSGPSQAWSGWNSYPSMMQILHKGPSLEQGSPEYMKMNKSGLTSRA